MKMRKARHNQANWKPALIITLLLVMIGGGFFGIYQFEQLQREKDAALYSDADETPAFYQVELDGVSYKLKRNLDTYLLMGLDKFSDTLSSPDSYINNQQADFLFLIVVDHNQKTYSAIHLNRDTMTKIQRLGINGKKIGSFTGQLALAHTYGSGGKDSCRNTVQAVSDYLYQVPIEHYISITMDGLPILNDLVGGVTVHIDDDFSEIDPTLVQGKDIRLKGQQALTFVRARWYVSDNSNLSRMNRQREYINSLLKQLESKLRSDEHFGVSMLNKLSDYIVSDLLVDELANSADMLKTYSFGGILTINGEAVKGEKYMEFYPDEASLKALVKQVFLEKLA